MPTNAESLRITERYRAEMLRLRRLAQNEATKIWARVDLANLDATYDLSRLVNTVTSIQGELTQLSAGYVSAFIRSETGEAPLIANIDQSQVGKARSGNPLYRSLRSPVIAMKQAIAEGETPAKARTAARKQLVRIVGVATDEAARESLRATMDASPEVVGWQRAVKGTCPACIGAADGSTKPAGESLDIHPSCQCVAEPQVSQHRERLNSQQTTKYFKQRGAEARLTAAERETARRWQGSASQLPNKWLREGRPLSEFYAHDRAFVQAMDGVLEKVGATGRPVQVWRGIPSQSLDKLGDLSQLVGKTFTDPGFVATTPLRDEITVWSGGSGNATIWDLTIDPRVKALWEEGATGEDSGLQETILERGCRFSVTKVERTKKGWQIAATVLPPK